MLVFGGSFWEIPFAKSFFFVIKLKVRRDKKQFHCWDITSMQVSFYLSLFSGKARLKIKEKQKKKKEKTHE